MVKITPRQVPTTIQKNAPKQNVQFPRHPLTLFGKPYTGNETQWEHSEEMGCKHNFEEHNIRREKNDT